MGKGKGGVLVVFHARDRVGTLDWPCDGQPCLARQVHEKCCKSAVACAAAGALAQLVEVQGGAPTQKDRKVKRALLAANGDVYETAAALGVLPLEIVDSLVRLL